MAVTPLPAAAPALPVRVLTLFLLGPLAGIWILKGQPLQLAVAGDGALTDPLTLLQSLAAGQWPIPPCGSGLGLVLAGYWLVGGGCSAPGSVGQTWSPMPHAWLRGRLGLKEQWSSSTALPATGCWPWCWWHLPSPACWCGSWSIRCRSPCGACCSAWGRAGACWRRMFLFDLLVVEQGWCGHPLSGGGLLASWSAGSGSSRLQPRGAEQCSNCMDCYAVCRSVPILRGPVHGARRGHGPLIAAQECTNCGRCIDVCAEQVLKSL